MWGGWPQARPQHMVWAECWPEPGAVGGGLSFPVVGGALPSWLRALVCEEGRQPAVQAAPRIRRPWHLWREGALLPA